MSYAIQARRFADAILDGNFLHHGLADALVERGWFDNTGEPTALGVEGFRDVERRTDVTAAPAWTGIDVERLVELLTPLSQACARHLPFSNPIGLRPPAPS